MHNKHHKTKLDILGPWQTPVQSDEQNDMNMYCDKVLPSINKNASERINYKINQQYSKRITNLGAKKYRPKSNAGLHEPKKRNKQMINNKENNRPIVQDENSQNKCMIEQKINQQANKINHRYDNTNYRDKEVTLASRNSNRTLRQEKRPSSCLQEVNIQNFVIEGSTQREQPQSRRKQSAFVLKHKFAQIRKSISMSASTSINMQFRASRGTFRENNNDKQNLILKLIKYECMGG